MVFPSFLKLADMLLYIEKSDVKTTFVEKWRKNFHFSEIYA